MGRILFYLGVIMVLFAGLKWYAQRALYAAPGEHVPEEAPKGLEAIELTGSQGRISTWFREHPLADETTPVVLFFHGNAENLTTLHLSGFYQQMEQLGVALAAMDYPGYGRSQGKPTPETLTEAALITLKHLRERFPQRPLVICGWSLGAATAVQAAAATDVAFNGLILLSPWSSLRDVGRAHYPNFLVPIALPDSFNSTATAPEIAERTLIIHGEADDIIPVDQGVTLSQALPDCKIITLPTYGHAEIIIAPQLWGEMSVFLKGDLGLTLKD